MITGTIGEWRQKQKFLDREHRWLSWIKRQPLSDNLLQSLVKVNFNLSQSRWKVTLQICSSRSKKGHETSEEHEEPHRSAFLSLRVFRTFWASPGDLCRICFLCQSCVSPVLLSHLADAQYKYCTVGPWRPAHSRKEVNISGYPTTRMRDSDVLFRGKTCDTFCSQSTEWLIMPYIAIGY